MNGARYVTVVLLALLWASPSRTHADIEAQGPQASIRFPIASLPAAISAPEFTVFAWYRPSATANTQAAILQVPGLMALRIDPGNAVSATVTKDGVTSAATATIQLAPGEWSLLAVSLRASDGRLYVFAQGETAPLKVGAITVPGLAGNGAGPAAGGMAIGGSPAGLPAAQGLYGMIAVRTRWINAADFTAVWESRRHWAPFDAATTGTGAPGSRGSCVWMTNHAMTTGPVDGGTGQWTFDRAAVVGQPVGIGNIHVYTTAPTWYARMLNVVVPVTAAEGFVYRSHSDPPYDGFFVPDLPDSGLVGDVVPRPSPRARQLVTGPQQPLFVIVSANSRGVNGHDGSAFGPGNYAHGFIDRNLSRVMGILLRPAVLTSGAGRWFGFDIQAANPPQSPAGTIVQLSGNPSPAGTFSRFWTGSMGGNAMGPGDGVFLDPGAFYGMRCKPEPGSLLVADAPLHVVAHVLRFPGSSPLTWRSDKGVNPQADGTMGPTTQVNLDTTAWTRTLALGDHMLNGTTLVVAGDHTSAVHVGDACFVSEGPAAGSISAITGIVSDGSRTTIDFSHPFHSAPEVGSTLRVGPWAFDRIEYTWPALTASDPEVFRGLRLGAGAEGGGAVVFAFSAWRPGVTGYAFGTAGWGGHGYQQQIDLSFPGSIAATAAASGAHVWVQVPAQQWSGPESMSGYTQRLRAGSPQMEIVWAGELQHQTQYPATGPEGWGQYILDHAAAQGVVGIVSFEHPRLGDFRQQLADGLRQDGEHLSHRGNRVQADVWTELLERGAPGSCRPDLNGDGFLNLADFGAFQNFFALADPRADFNGDGVLNLADFGAFQTAFALGC